jgi:hypothetical protein
MMQMKNFLHTSYNPQQPQSGSIAVAEPLQSLSTNERHMLPSAIITHSPVQGPSHWPLLLPSAIITRPPA